LICVYHKLKEKLGGKWDIWMDIHLQPSWLSHIDWSEFGVFSYRIYQLQAGEDNNLYIPMCLGISGRSDECDTGSAGTTYEVEYICW